MGTIRGWSRASLVIVLVVVASLAASCGNSAESGDETTTYSNDEYGFSFDYDSGMFTEMPDIAAQGSAGGGSAFQVGFFDENGTKQGEQYRDGITVAVYEFDQEIDESAMADFKDYIQNRLLPELDSAFASGVSFGELGEVEREGLSGFRIDAAYEMEGTPFMATLYFLISGATEYQITLQAAKDRWSELEPVFQEVIDTFSVETTASSP